MKKLLVLALAVVCAVNYSTKVQAGKPKVNVGGIIYGVGQYIQNSKQNEKVNHYRPRINYYPSSRTVYLPKKIVFGSRTHTGALSIELKELANLMCVEAYAHYRHNHAFSAIYRDMYKIRTDAKHLIHLTNSHHRDVHGDDHIAADLYEIDQLFHRVETGVRGWTADHPGHDVLPEKMEAVEDVIHHLMKDYGVTSKIGNGNIPLPLPGGNPSDEFGARLHVRKLAMQLNRRSANMCLVAHGHYRHNPAFSVIYRDMYQVMKESQHILELANNNANDDHIAADLNDIDQLFHKVENGVKLWKSNNPYHSDLPEALEATEDTIHHLMEDFGVKSNIGNGNIPVPVPGNVPLPAVN